MAIFKLCRLNRHHHKIKRKRLNGVIDCAMRRNWYNGILCVIPDESLVMNERAELCEGMINGLGEVGLLVTPLPAKPAFLMKSNGMISILDQAGRQLRKLLVPEQIEKSMMTAGKVLLIQVVNGAPVSADYTPVVPSNN